VAAKWRYEAAIRAAVVAKWRYEAAVRAAVAAKWRAAAAAAAMSSVSYRAMQNALSRVGAPYVWGGQGPWGFDCSGLVAWAFRSAGYYLPGGSYNQIGYGSYVGYNNLQPGDLVFYGPGGSQHVAIYIGNGNVVQASNYNTGVHIASIWYIGSPSAYKRI
jgi:cell wall-associated NlpC family hydrolase